MKIYPTIAEALTLGGSKLAVDGVVLVGEHGTYPRNEKGQTKYPRYEFFQQIVKVFDRQRPLGAGVQRQAPVVELGLGEGDVRHVARDGVSAHGRVEPAGDVADAVGRDAAGRAIREALCVCYGGVDSYDFHGLETIQCMVERRRGGETGVKWVQAYRGETFWKAHQEGVWPQDLMEAALCRSHTLTPARAGLQRHLPDVDDMQRTGEGSGRLPLRAHDGLKCTMLLMNGLVEDFNFAAQRGRPAGIVLHADVSADAATAARRWRISSARW